MMIKRTGRLAVWAFCLSLVGCGQPAVLPSGSVETQAMAAASGTLSDTDVLALVRLLSDTTAAGAPALDVAKIQTANRILNYESSKRDEAYTIADPLIERYFNMPGKPDSIPRLNAQDMQALKSTLQPGDVIQCGNDGSFIHGVFYVGDDVIIHALAEPMHGKAMVGVIKETLSGYFSRVERDQVVVLRPHWTPAQLQAGIAYAEGQVGKDYDSLFLTTSSDRFYCTELVYKILTTTKVARVEPRVVGGCWPVVMNEELRKSPDLTMVYRKNHV